MKQITNTKNMLLFELFDMCQGLITNIGSGIITRCSPYNRCLICNRLENLSTLLYQVKNNKLTNFNICLVTCYSLFVLQNTR